MLNFVSLYNKYKEKKRKKMISEYISDANVYIGYMYKPVEYKTRRFSSDDVVYFQGEYKTDDNVYYQEENIPNDDIFEDMEPTFSQMLFKLIKQQGISETDCYKNANIDRKLFSKIRSYNGYQPKRTTVFALIIALKLNLEDADILLNCAGYSLSHSIKQDVVIEFAIKKQIYDIDIVNEILYSLGCQTLGNKE